MYQTKVIKKDKTEIVVLDDFKKETPDVYTSILQNYAQYPVMCFYDSVKDVCYIVFANEISHVEIRKVNESVDTKR